MNERAVKIDTGTTHLLARIEQGVAVLTFNRPEARNALSNELSQALRQQLADLRDDDRVRALLLTGSGSAFCAGGDVKGMGDNRPTASSLAFAAESNKQRHRGVNGMLKSWRKPTVAALPGAAVGAGLAMSLACDIRLAAESAFLSTGYARIGLSGDYGIAWLLTHLVGTSRARELMFSSERIESGKAERLGLINRIYADDDLQQEALNYAARLAAGPTACFARMKDNLDKALEIDFIAAIDMEAENLQRTFQTDDHKEAVKAFIEKREPVFSGH